MLAYMLAYATFFLSTSVHILLHPLRYRLIHVNNMPDFLVLSAWLPRLLGRPVIHDVHDLMPELYLEKFGSDETRFPVRVLKLQERWAAKFSSAVRDRGGSASRTFSRVVAFPGTRFTCS